MTRGDWVGARVLCGVATVLGLLLAILAAWWLRGLDEANRLFQLLQGVLLGTLAWLYGTQGLERAEAVARAEAAARQRLADAAARTEARASRLEEEGSVSARVLAILSEDPRLQEKIDAAIRQVEEGWR